MASKHQEIYSRLTRELEARGAINYEFISSDNHDRLVVWRGDRSRFVVFSKHARDPRAIRNNVATLRRELDTLGFPR